MNRILAKCAVFVTAATMTFAPLGANISAAGAQALNPAAATCQEPNRPAATIKAVPPELPEMLAMQHVTGTTYVQVDLDANGSIETASVLKSSGAGFLDRAALTAAHQSSFQPEVRDCASVAGSYIFQVDFTE